MLPRSDPRFARVIAFYLGWAASGAAQALTTNYGTHYVIWMVIAGAAATWTMFDARAREQPLLPIVQFVMFWLWTVAVPFYLIYSRGWRGVMWTIANIAGLTATLLTTHFGAYAAMYATGAYG